MIVCRCLDWPFLGFVVVRQLSTELEAAYGRKFTIDGHLLGSIGEVVAREALAAHYGPAGVGASLGTTAFSGL